MKMKTNNDCLKSVPGAFELVLVTALRAKAIYAKMQIESEYGTKIVGRNPVKIALYEIATNALEYDALKNNFINSIRKTHDMESIDDMEE